MAAITRVEGPMLLANLDRQGTDLTFTTTGSSLFYMNFSQFRVGINTETTTEDLTVNGNIAVTTVKIDKFSTISTTQTNQNLTLTANGNGNVVVINANVISGNIDNTQIGSVTPSRAFFTRANVVTKAELKLANVQNLSGNRIVFTSADNTQLEDNAGLQWFGGNATLVAQNFLTVQTGTFPGITSNNVIIPTIGNNSIVYMSANSQIVGTPSLSFFAGNGLFRLTGNIIMTGQTQNRVIYKNSSDQLVTSERFTFDGISFTSPYPNSNLFGNIRLSGDTIELINPNNDLTILTQTGTRIGFGFRELYGVSTFNGDPSLNPDVVATVAYVQNALQGVTISLDRISSYDSAVRIFDGPSFTVPNITITVDGIKNSEFTNGYGNIQDISIHDAVISSKYGEIYLSPYANSRLRVQSNSSIAIPSGTTAQRPAVPIRGDFRHNSEYNVLEWNDGSNWSSTTPTFASQTLPSDGTTTVFTLTRAASSETVLITINGVVQQTSSGSYSVNANILTFAEAPLATDVVEVRFLTLAITYASTPLFVNTPYTIFGTNFTIIDTWFITQYRGVEYSFTFKNQANNQYAMGMVYMMHDGYETYLNVKEYSNGAAAYLTFDSYVTVQGVAVLRAKAANSGSYIKFRATYFSDDVLAYVTWLSSGLLATLTDSQRTSINIQLSATTSGSGSVSYNLYSGNLPPGTILSQSGVIAGATTAVASPTTYTFTVVAIAPTAAAVVSNTLSIVILPP